MGGILSIRLPAAHRTRYNARPTSPVTRPLLAARAWPPVRRRNGARSRRPASHFPGLNSLMRVPGGSAS